MISVLLTARSLRSFADGFVAVLLPAYLLALADALRRTFLAHAAIGFAVWAVYLRMPRARAER